MSLSLLEIPSAASTNLVIIIFSAVSFNDPNSKIEFTLKSPTVFINNPVPVPVPSVIYFKVAVIAALSMVLINPG